MRKSQRVLSILIFALLTFAIAFPAGAAQSKAGLSPETEGLSQRANASQAGWISTVQESLWQSEYQITWQENTPLNGLGASFQAPNRAHDLRTYFTPEGIRVISRLAGQKPEWEWGLRLSRFGFEGQLRPAGKAMNTFAAGNRFEYQYQAAVQEWLINDPAGLEHGFTIAEPPSVESSADLVLELSLSGNLVPVLDEGGQAVEFYTKDGVQVLRYSELKVADASAQRLPASMRLSEAGRSLHIVVQAAGAVYPILVDPLATSPSWSVQSNQGGAQLGASVASAGDVNGDGYDDILVGAPKYDAGGNADAGTARIYLGTGSVPGGAAAWTIQGAAAGALLGQSVSTAGDVNGDGYADVIVGAPGANSAALFFGGNPMNTTPDWTATGGAGDHFGFSVASAGDVNGDGYQDVIVGAYTAGTGGRAYVYHGSAGGVSGAANWQAEASQAGADLGYSVSRAGDVNGDGYEDVLAGAPGYAGPNTDEGAVFLWYGEAGGVNGGVAGTQGNSDWKAEGEQDSARLGASVSWAGDANGDGYGDVVTGAPGYSNGNTAEGGVFLWYGSYTGVNAGTSGTPANADFSAEGGVDNANAGSSMGLAGDVNGDGYADIVYGAPGIDSAYVHFGSPAGIQSAAAWTNTGSGSYGAAVNGVGDVNGDGYSDIIVGSPLYESEPAHTDEGRVLVYSGGSYSLSADAVWQFSVAGGSQLGSSVDTAGDVNGDGYDDVIIGAWNYDGGITDEGAVFVFYGSATGLSPSWNWKAESNQLSARLGTFVSRAGDVNGDGYADIAAGARAYDNGETDEGAVFVWYGSSAGLVAPGGTPANANWIAESNQQGAWMGDAISTAGDVNGDGYDDMIIGASRYDHPEENEGAAFVWYGSSTGLGPNGNPANADWMAESDQVLAGNFLEHTVGKMVDTAGDVNGDGYDDVVVGFSFYDKPMSDEGVAFVWYGSANGLGVNGSPNNADWLAESNQTASFFGVAVGSAGDVNGDGYDDLIIGAYHYDRPEVGEGIVFVWHGSASGLNNGINGNETNPAWSADSDQELAFYGAATGGAGDVNGDGYADVFVGDQSYQWEESQNAGMVDVYLGSSAGLSATYAWRATGSEVANAHFGNSVSTAGDVNGDGYNDLIVGELRYAIEPDSEHGRAYLYYGNGGDGYSTVPQQRRADNSAPVPDGGQSISPTEVRLAAVGRMPFGSGSVRMQWEVKPLGTPFNGSGLGQSAWHDSGQAGYAFNELIGGLTFESSYHWRVRFLGRPDGAPDTSAITYRSRWIYGDAFFTALSGTQAIAVGTNSLLGQAAYVNVGAGQQGSLTSLVLRGYPDTAHPQEDFRSGGDNMLNRYFTLTPNAGASGYTVRLCLNYNQAEVTGLNESLLRLCRWTGSSWSCPNRSASSDASANLVCADNVTQLSDWTIGQVGPTDVDLVTFRVTPGNSFSAFAKVLVTSGLVLCLLGLVWLGLRRKN